MKGHHPKSLLFSKSWSQSIQWSREDSLAHLKLYWQSSFRHQWSQGNKLFWSGHQWKWVWLRVGLNRGLCDFLWQTERVNSCFQVTSWLPHAHKKVDKGRWAERYTICITCAHEHENYSSQNTTVYILKGWLEENCTSENEFLSSSKLIMMFNELSLHHVHIMFTSGALHAGGSKLESVVKFEAVKGQEFNPFQS